MFNKKNDKILALNWKMNPETLNEALVIAKKSDYENAIVIPPFIFIDEVGKNLKKAKLGAQDLFWNNPPKGVGPYTGAVSAEELVNLGVKYVIVGHSERRAMGESDELISQKIKTALSSGLIPILCVGENKEQRENGLTKKVIENQLEKDLQEITNLKDKKHLIVAYEPIWAIGTGNPETPENALEIIKYIKRILNSKYDVLHSKVLYGGSITSENINKFINCKEIDGVLIGGASLKPELIFN